MGEIIYVDDYNDTGPWDGKSVATAFRRVEDGLAIARLDDWVWLLSQAYEPEKEPSEN